MKPIRNYQRCHVSGEGKLSGIPAGRSHPVRVVDISAFAVRIHSGESLDLDAAVMLELRFSSHIMGIHLKTEGRIIKKEKAGAGYDYVVKFINLRNEQRVEIDEIVRRTCMIDHMIHFTEGTL